MQYRVADPKIRRKINALLTLADPARGGTESECEAAWDKAQQLTLTHGVPVTPAPHRPQPSPEYLGSLLDREMETRCQARGTTWKDEERAAYARVAEAMAAAEARVDAEMSQDEAEGWDWLWK